MPAEVSVSPPLLSDCAFFFTSLHSPPVTLIELTVFGELKSLGVNMLGRRLSHIKKQADICLTSLKRRKMKSARVRWWLSGVGVRGGTPHPRWRVTESIVRVSISQPLRWVSSTTAWDKAIWDWVELSTFSCLLWHQSEFCQLAREDLSGTRSVKCVWFTQPCCREDRFHQQVTSGWLDSKF